jgi:hypothetical protein
MPPHLPRPLTRYVLNVVGARAGIAALMRTPGGKNPVGMAETQNFASLSKKTSRILTLIKIRDGLSKRIYSKTISNISYRPKTDNRGKDQTPCF